MTAVSTQVYIYQQITRVVVYETGDGEYFDYRYYTVYAQKLKINKGVDNVLLFQFINQEEKPVNISGAQFTFRLIDTEGTKMLLEIPLVTLNAATGRAKVTIPAMDLLEIDAQPASYSISRKILAPGGLNEAVYTDAQCGARASIDVVDSIEPEFVPSAPITIPTTQLTNQTSIGGTSFQDWTGWANPYYSGYMSTYTNAVVAGQNTEFFSSHFVPRGAITTVQLELVGYTGTIKAQAAENYQSLWYNVTDSTTYLNKTGSIHLNIVGWYPLLRLCFNNSLYATLNPPGYPALAAPYCTNGVITSVEIQNPGSGYMAPPLVTFVGDGSGATATAAIDANGSVTSITVTNGGSGYWPLPVTTPNPNKGYPIPNANAGALCLLSTGYIASIWYR